MISDRAALIATAMQQITNCGALTEAERRQHIEALVRDEIVDICREIAGDRRDEDDA
jgi:hypothetical protein